MRLTTARRLSRTRNNILWTLAAALALFSCSRNAVYSHYEPVSLDGWERSDTLFFDITTPRDSGVFSSELGVRITERYPYQELALVMEQTLLPAGKVTTDTVNVRLTDPEGHYEGKGLSIIDTLVPMDDIALGTTDTLKVSIRHMMRREVLPGISDIGITLEKKH